MIPTLSLALLERQHNRETLLYQKTLQVLVNRAEKVGSLCFVMDVRSLGILMGKSPLQASEILHDLATGGLLKAIPVAGQAMAMTVDLAPLVALSGASHETREKQVAA